MKALQVTSIKTLMNQLLAGNTFDIFLLEEAMITTAVTYSIDGHVNRDFFTPQELEDAFLYEFNPWSEMKELCFNLIKGKKTPLNFKFMLRLKPEHMERLYKKELPDTDLSNLKALILLIKYDGTAASITTGISYESFTLDKEPEKLWDATISKYLANKGISFEEK